MSEAALTAGVKSWKMWFALLGGAGAWAAHLMLAYAIAEFGCVAGWGHAPGAISTVSWMLIVVSAAMTALAALALLVAYRVGHRVGAAEDPDDRETVEYVARFGKITNALFLFVIIVESVPIVFYLGRC